MQAFRELNGYLTEKAPWHMKGDELATERQIVVRATLEAVYALSHFLLPFIPIGASCIFKKLNKAPMSLPDIRSDLCNLTVGTKIDVGEILYDKVSLTTGVYITKYIGM
jgi:methionyl-tRNA synthetase